jgi:hypothetical protein
MCTPRGITRESRVLRERALAPKARVEWLTAKIDALEGHTLSAKAKLSKSRPG